MKSQYVESFNHDADASTYDQHVSQENHPIRTGYNEALNWVLNQAGIQPTDRVLELGSGTGNLTQRLPRCREVVCVDVSRNMETIAFSKVSGLKNRSFVCADVLEFFDSSPQPFDVVISTYTIHHLTESEKQHFFRLLYSILNPGGRAVFGDLMLASGSDRQPKAARYRSMGQESVACAIEEEFFWFLDTATSGLRELGFSVTTRSFSDLSHGILAVKSR